MTSDGDTFMAQESGDVAVPTVNEWDKLVVAIGRLTLATGYLELAVISIVCRVLGKTEYEINAGKFHSNGWWCTELNTVAPPEWATVAPSLASLIENVRGLYRRRNQMIHAALGIVADGSLPGAPAGSVVDLRTFGIGFRSRQGNTWTIGVVGDRIEIPKLDELTKEIHDARLTLVPFMELADKIKHPPRPFAMPEVGKRL